MSNLNISTSTANQCRINCSCTTEAKKESENNTTIFGGNFYSEGTDDNLCEDKVQEQEDFNDYSYDIDGSFPSCNEKGFSPKPEPTLFDKIQHSIKEDFRFNYAKRQDAIDDAKNKAKELDYEMYYKHY